MEPSTFFPFELIYNKQCIAKFLDCNASIDSPFKISFELKQGLGDLSFFKKKVNILSSKLQSCILEDFCTIIFYSENAPNSLKDFLPSKNTKCGFYTLINNINMGVMPGRRIGIKSLSTSSSLLFFK